MSGSVSLPGPSQGLNPPPLRDVPDQGSGSTRGTDASRTDFAQVLAQYGPTGGPGGAALTAQVTSEVAQAGPLDRVGQAARALAPDAAVYGLSTGSLFPTKFQGGVFSISPSLNPGDPRATIFISKPLGGRKLSDTFSLGHGLVSTWNPSRGKVEGGYGGTAVLKTPLGAAFGFANARVGDIDLKNFSGTISGNVGVAFQLNKLAAAGLQEAAVFAALTPALQEAVPGLAAGAALARESDKVVNAWAGVGYRVEFKFEKGELEGIYHKGQKIDLEAFLKGAVEERYKPPLTPNQGHPSIANLNSTTQLIFGTSPWDLAEVSAGKNHGNGAVAVANQWKQTLGEFGLKYSAQLPPDENLTVLLGPKSNADAAKAARALLDVATPEDKQKIVQGLSNVYDVDLGVPEVKLQNNLRQTVAGGTPRPGDYDFTRAAFEGKFRYPGDNSPPTPPPGGGLGV